MLRSYGTSAARSARTGAHPAGGPGYHEGMSEITLRYFAAAAEAAGAEEEAWEPVGAATLAGLRSALVERYGEAMAKVLRSGSFLVDGRVRRDDGPIGGSRVDVLPPFAGG